MQQEKEEDKTMVPTLSDSEFFYNKLSDLLESSGLSLILNVRETLLDLYLVYLEVTRRGGYKQVGEENKWCEVASALKLDDGNCNANLSVQLQNLYFQLLYPFEKLYFYRSPPTQATISSTKVEGTSQVGLLPQENVITTKDKQVVVTQTNILPETIPKRRKHRPKVVKEGKSKRTTKAANSGAECVEKNEKKMKKRVGAPLGQKNAYHIFLKQECARLKTCRDLDRCKILSMAVDSWRNMSEIEKQPYVEESKKLKEKGKEAMMIEKKEESMEEKRPSSVCFEITEEASK